MSTSKMLSIRLGTSIVSRALLPSLSSAPGHVRMTFNQLGGVVAVIGAARLAPVLRTVLPTAKPCSLRPALTAQSIWPRPQSQVRHLQRSPHHDVAPGAAAQTYTHSLAITRE